MKIILASASPRRKELLEQLGLEFTIQPAQGEETITQTAPAEIVKELAMQKAQEIYQQLPSVDQDTIIIGSDTLVFFDGSALGKPKNPDHAREMLTMLSGHTHQVYTGVCTIFVSGDSTVAEPEILSFAESTDVKMFPMTTEEIDAYIASGEPMDKAGAYAIQGLCAKYIAGIQGDYNTVVGLPIGQLWQKCLKKYL